MDIVALRRRHTSWSIQQNPVTITIQRTEKVDAGGYFDEVISSHGPFVVRIFQQRSSIPQDVATLAGTKQTDKAWSLLADYQADIQAGPNLKDEFDVVGLGHFLVVVVHPQTIQGELVGYQVDLEKVS